jgi:hypothetical protein
LTCRFRSARSASSVFFSCSSRSTLSSSSISAAVYIILQYIILHYSAHFYFFHDVLSYILCHIISFIFVLYVIISFIIILCNHHAFLSLQPLHLLLQSVHLEQQLHLSSCICYIISYYIVLYRIVLYCIIKHIKTAPSQPLYVLLYYWNASLYVVL